MEMGFQFTATRVWDCRYCGERNVTRERDLFRDQCRNCTRYNDVDWERSPDVTLEEAATLADELEAE